MSLKPKPVALWLTVPLLAMNLIACGDNEEVPPPGGVSELCGNGELDEGEECDDGNRNNQDNCTNLCTKAACGDGIVALKATPAEECDDGNAVDNDACTSECKAARCGDGIKQPGEACDDGNTDDDDACTSACALPTCGDGEVQPGEECDDGNKRDDDECSNTCLEPSCGDGIVQAGEECDEGGANSNSGSCTRECKEATCGDGLVQAGVEACDPLNDDNCTEDCKLPTCGDGIVQEGEECDDGNNNDADDCNNVCLSTGCGDGIVQPGEECDDGNKSNNDKCLNTCVAATCGDGFLHNQDGGNETCDEGDENGPLPAYCSETCIPNNCGNGVIEPGEDCDDGNNDNNDSCLNNCQWNECGDGHAYLEETNSNNPNDLEECDDGNDDNTDPCTSACEWNTCGDGERYTSRGDEDYDDGNPDDDNPYELEQCDDGNDDDTDSCIRFPNPDVAGGFECVFNRCGDGRVYTTVTDTNNPYGTEECDDADDPNDPDANNDSCLTSCEWNSCHDGWVYEVETDPKNPNDLEQCDDGNTSNSDACVGECLRAECGDAYVWVGTEECDDGNSNNSDACSNSCELGTCGNGTVEAGEECDDGNENDNDSCLTTCQWNRCGDGYRYVAVTDTKNPNALERCDDGNGIETDHCTSTCNWNTCGDGKPYVLDVEPDCDAGRGGQVCDIDEEAGVACDDDDLNPMNDCSNLNGFEQCDDGNADDSDSCISSCQWNSCGDGAAYTTVTDLASPNEIEECDDGLGGSAACTNACTVPTCGDGIITPELGETCDHGIEEEGCGLDCKLDSCGNGELDPGEECDDGNTNNADSCNDRCIEARCGDGIVQPSLGEECDDGNTDNTDECSNACQEARCGDGLRQAGEECDTGIPVKLVDGEVEEIDLNDDGERLRYDDGFIDDAGYCSNTCELQCFPNPNRAWADTWDDETCVFVPEEMGDTTGDEYNEIGTAGFVQVQTFCQSLGIGANLVKIDSESKNEFVYDLVKASLDASPDPNAYLTDSAGCDEFVYAVYDAEAETLVCFSVSDGGFGDEVDCPETADDALDKFGVEPTECGTEPPCLIPIDDDGGDPVLCTDKRFPYWIGLYDDHTTQVDPPGLWKWISDGSAVSGGNNGGANPLWLAGQPDDLDNDTNTPGQEDCGAMLGGDADGQVGEWADENCGARYRFVCEFPLRPAP